MGLTKLAIVRPIAIFAFFMGLVVMGIVSYLQLPKELNPKVDIPVVTISTQYSGTSPHDMETLITKPIEDSIAGVSGIKEITSSSVNGQSTISIEFYLGTNLDTAASDVTQKVDAVRKSLPTDADAPAVSKVDTSSTPVIYVAMSSSKRSGVELRSIADNTVLSMFEEAPSVGSVTDVGGDVREIRVAARPDRLAAYGMTATQLATAVNNANVNVSTGYIQKGDIYLNVHMLGEFTSVNEIKNLKITNNGKSFYLKDVANVMDTIQDKVTDSNLDGRKVVNFIVQKSTDGNTVDVSNGIRAEILRAKKLLPSDIQFTVTNDQSTTVLSNLQDVDVSLFLGAFMAVIVVFVFLHNIRGTVIVAIAIPISIIATFFPIKLMGFTLNSMTLMGLSLSVGILVDDSIVVLENINRHLALGEEPTVAAINGRSEIALAAITLTSVDLAVFLPIATMSGVIGEFFLSFGSTCAIATLFSLLVSFTVTPMLASRWYRKGEEHTYTKGFAGRFDKSFFAFEELYRNTLRHILKHPYIAVLIGNAILVAAAYFIGPQLGFRFVPGQDTNQVAVTIEAPDGASLDYTRKICAQISQIVRSTPSLNNDIKFITTRLGRAGGGGGGLGSQFTGTQYGTVTLTLYDRKSVIDNFTGTKEHLRNRSDVDVATELRKVTAKIAGAQLITAEISGTGSGAAIQIRLNGSEFPKIMGVAQQVLDIVRKEPGTTDTDISYKNSEPEVQVRVDRNKAPEFGLQSSDIANALSTAFEGNTNTEYRDPIDTQQYYINIINSLSSRSSASQVGDVIVGYYNNAPVYLKQVADLTVGTGPVKIDHINRERNVTISAYLRNGYEVGNVTQSILAKANKLNLGNVSVTTGGEAQRMGDEFGFMAEAFILGIVLSYLLMAALFNNLLYPFSILLSLPQAWVGAMLALWISKLPFSLIAGIGIVMLNGIVQKNAILLVDYANGLRRKGYERNDALIATGPLRLRPIMMTTIAIVVSSLPTALALGRGAQFRQALGITVIGGVLVALMLTLLIVPCAYVVWDDIGTLFVRIKEHLNSQRIRDMETSMENDLSSDEVDDKDDQ